MNPEIPKKIPRSKLAITAFVLSFLSIISGAIRAAPAIVLAVIALVKIKDKKGVLRGKALAISAIIIAGLSTIISYALFTLWTLDAEPLPREYTIADLRSAPDEYAQTYQLVKTLANPGEADSNASPAIGLSPEDVNSIKNIHKIIADANYWQISDTLTANAHEIEHIWKKAKNGRVIIDKLSGFEQIADLSTPDMNLDNELLFATNLIRLGLVYHSYILLQADQGKHQHAIEELIKFDSVFRKLSVNARDFFLKFSCFWGIESNIKVANSIVNDSRISKALLEPLSQHFTPLNQDQLALRNPILFHWFTFTRICKEEFDKPEIRRKGVVKWNSTMCLYHNYFTRQLELAGELGRPYAPVSVWPKLFPDWLPQSVGSKRHLVPWSYIIYNPTPAVVFSVTTPTYMKRYEHRDKLRLIANLFQVVFYHRFGKDISELDFIIHEDGDKFVLDSAGGRMSFIGPDCKIGTQDDVTLHINPEVLGLGSRSAAAGPNRQL